MVWLKNYIHMRKQREILLWENIDYKEPRGYISSKNPTSVYKRRSPTRSNLPNPILLSRFKIQDTTCQNHAFWCFGVNTQHTLEK